MKPMKSQDASIRPGIVGPWERRDGTRFFVEHIDLENAWYWQISTSGPRYRSIRLDRLHRLYRKVVKV